MFLIVGLPLLAAAIIATRRSGLCFLHFCIYLTLISIFDLFALVLLMSNDICKACSTVHFLESLTLMSRTACVVTTLNVNAIHHAQVRSATRVKLSREVCRERESYQFCKEPTSSGNRFFLFSVDFVSDRIKSKVLFDWKLNIETN